MKPTALILSLLALAAAAHADDFPHLKPGLWETRMGDDAPQGPHSPVKSLLCLDRPTEDLLNKGGAALGARMCKQLSVHSSGNTVTVDSVCMLGGSKMTSKAARTYNGDTSYHEVVDSRVDPPMAGMTQSHSTRDAKWVGACPADMHPGELVTKLPDGHEVRQDLRKMVAGASK